MNEEGVRAGQVVGSGPIGGPAAEVPAAVAPVPGPAVPATAAPAAAVAQEMLAADLLDDEESDLPAVGRVWEGPKESLATIMARSRAAQPTPTAAVKPARPGASNVEPVALGDLPAQKRAMLALLAEKAPGLHGIVSQGEFVGVQDGQAVIRISKNFETFVKRLDQNGKKELIREVVSQVLKQSVGVRFDLTADGAEAAPAGRQEPAGPGGAPGPAAAPAVATTAPPPPATPTVRVTDELRQQLYADEPLVRAVVDRFGGKVINLEQNP